MKLKIKVKLLNPNNKLEIHGDWIDLIAENGLKYNANEDVQINLGVAMKLPDGFEAIVAPRSSLYIKKHLLLTNSIGVIDNAYNGNTDYWIANFRSTQDGTIIKGERIVQFRIQLSQKATIWQKIKWLFSTGIQLEYVDILSPINRGGIGSTNGYIND